MATHSPFTQLSPLAQAGEHSPSGRLVGLAQEITRYESPAMMVIERKNCFMGILRRGIRGRKCAIFSRRRDRLKSMWIARELSGAGLRYRRQLSISLDAHCRQLYPDQTGHGHGQGPDRDKSIIALHPPLKWWSIAVPSAEADSWFVLESLSRDGRIIAHRFNGGCSSEDSKLTK